MNFTNTLRYIDTLLVVCADEKCVTLKLVIQLSRHPKHANVPILTCYLFPITCKVKQKSIEMQNDTLKNMNVNNVNIGSCI